MNWIVIKILLLFALCYNHTAVANIQNLIAKKLVAGTYLGNITEINGTTIDEGIVSFSEIFYIDGTFTIDSYAPDNSILPTKINSFYAQGEWEITKILDNGDIVVSGSYSGMFIDNPPFFAPGGECIVGCLDKNYFSWIYEIRTGKMKNGVGNAVFIEYLTGKVVEGVTFPFKFSGIKTNLIEANKAILKSQGIPIPLAAP